MKVLPQFKSFPAAGLALLLVVFLISPPSADAADAPSKPNIIFILADDLGIGNVGCYGADNYKTPNIDALAATGTRYTRGFTAPLCGPSRALIMTGRYAFRTGATNQDRTGLMKPGVEVMMPAVLKSAGYVSSSVGKWGQLPLEPSDFGFDDFLRFRGSGVYWNEGKKGEKYTVNGTQKVLGDKEYMPDVMHAHAVDFITKHREEPFFLYYPLSHVHGEILPTPDSAPNSTDLFADNILYMDKLVGKLLETLDQLKLREKTLIVFLGDNGTGKAQSDRSTIGGRRILGQKGSMQEGGALVPMIVSWPAKVAAGKVSSDLIDSTDFLPTFAELTGSSLPSNTILDGRSFAPQLLGQPGKPREWIFIELGKEWYVRNANWKLNQEGALFDMSVAPFEEKLLAADTKDEAPLAARKVLQDALDQLNPAGGILDDGDGSGRHSSKKKGK